MQLDAMDVQYIRSKRRIYLTVFFLGIIARTVQVYTSYQEMLDLELAVVRPSHNCLGFVLLNLVLTIAFLSQFFPAAKRAGYTTWLESSLVLLLAVALLNPVGCFSIIAFFTILVVDQSLYKMLKKASRDALNKKGDPVSGIPS